jgi:hypothetical protein
MSTPLPPPGHLTYTTLQQYFYKFHGKDFNMTDDRVFEIKKIIDSTTSQIKLPENNISSAEQHFVVGPDFEKYPHKRNTIKDLEGDSIKKQYLAETALSEKREAPVDVKSNEMRDEIIRLVSLIFVEADKIKKIGRALGRSTKTLVQLELDILKASKCVLNWPSDRFVYKEVGYDSVSFAIADCAENLNFANKFSLGFPSKELRIKRLDPQYAFKDYIDIFTPADEEQLVYNDHVEWIVPSDQELE